MKKLVLIGYMGAGKSTVGQALAKRMQVLFWDLDAYIEEKQKRSISEIFAQDGEESFRQLETKYLKELLEREEDGVLSAGGGLPLRKENRELLKKAGYTVYLLVSKETVLERLKEDGSRPLLQVADRKARIEEMLQIRHPIYLEAANISIVTDGRTIEEIVEEILGNSYFGKNS